MTTEPRTTRSDEPASVGELSQRPAIVASSRVLGVAIFTSFWIVLPAAWPSP